MSSLSVRVMPFVSVNPSSRASPDSTAHRTAEFPSGPCPWMNVAPGPFALRTVIGLSMHTRAASTIPVG